MLFHTHPLHAEVRQFASCRESRLRSRDLIGLLKIAGLTENLDICFDITASFGDRDDMVEVQFLFRPALHAGTSVSRPNKQLDVFGNWISFGA